MGGWVGGWGWGWVGPVGWGRGGGGQGNDGMDAALDRPNRPGLARPGGA